MSVINPNTNRKVKVNTKSFKNLLKDFDFQNNILTPKDKTNYGFSEKLNHWILMSKVDNKYEKVNDLIKLKQDLVLAPSNRYIKRNGQAFKKFLKLGYEFKNNIFVKPEVSYEISNVDFSQFKFDKKKLKDAKKIVIVSEEQGNKYVDMSSKDLIEAIKQKTYDDNDFKIKVVETENVKFGPSYDGNQNCFITAIKTHICNQIRYKRYTEKHKAKLNDKFNQYFEEFEEGVFEEDIERIANDWKLLIKINENDNCYQYGDNYHFHNRELVLEYKNNHVEFIEQNVETKKEFVIIDKCDCIDNLEFDTKIICNHQIEKFINNIEINKIEQIQLSHDKIVKLVTNDKIYKYKFVCDFQLSNYEYTFEDKTYNDLFSYFSIMPQPIKSNCDIAKQVCNPMYYQLEDILNTDEFINLDLKNAYDQFNELPTDLLIKCNTNQMHNQIGFYYIKFHCIIRNIDIAEWHSTEYLNILNKHNVSYEIEQAMLSSNKTTLDINKFNDKYKSWDKRVFHKILGKFQKYRYRKRKLTTDYEIVRKYGGQKLLTIGNEDLYEYETNEFMNIYKKYYPHISGYIMEHTNSKILDTILTFKLKPLRIWADNIILKKSSKLDDELIKDTKFNIDYNFKYKIDMLISFKSNNDSKLNIKNTYYDLDSNDFIIGPAGTGKTYIINQYINNLKILILSPTNMALKNFKYDYKSTIASYLENHELYKPEFIIIDEISMVSQETYNLIKKHANCRVIGFGDFNQLQPVQGTPIDYKKYNYRVLTKIYRQDCEEFQNNLMNTLEKGDLSYIKTTKSITDCVNNDILILSSKNSHIDAINEIGYDLNDSEIINDVLKVNSPIIVINNDMKREGLVNGDYGYIKSYINNIVTININDTEYKLNELQLSNIKPAYSITYHKVQGQTINKPICLNICELNKYQRKNMLYVGVSRVRKLEHLNILVTHF